MGICNECKYKNSCDNLNYLDVANTCTDLKEFVDEIRADAIDECMRAIVNTESKVFNPCADKEWDVLTLLANRQFEILNILEKLKEQI